MTGSKLFSINLGGGGGGGFLGYPVLLDQGGTSAGLTLTPAVGGLVFQDAGKLGVSPAAGVSGQFAVSQGATAPGWAYGFSLTIPVKLSEGGTGQSLGGVLGAMIFSSTLSMNETAVGLSGQFLQSIGAGIPTWGYGATIVPYPLNMNLGGTGASIGPQAGTVIYSTATNLAKTSAGGSLSILMAQSTGAPIWSDCQYPQDVSANGLLYGQAISKIGELASANRGALGTNATGVPSIVASSASSQVFMRDAADNMVFGKVDMALGVTGFYPTTGLTGTLGLTLGGTGAALSASLGAIAFSSTISLALSAIGTSGQFLQSNGSAIPTWVPQPTAASTNVQITSVSSAYNVTLTDSFILASGSAFAITLPAVGVTGRQIQVEKTDAAFGNIIAINTTSNQMIGYTGTGGSTFTSLNTLGENVQLIDDGARWQVKRYIPSIWTNDGAMGISAITTGPTKGTSLVIDQFTYDRDGRYLVGWFTFYALNIGAQGTGDYLFRSVPVGISMDLNKLTTWTTAQNGPGAWTNQGNNLGYVQAVVATTLVSAGGVVPYNSFSIRLATISDISVGYVGSGYAGMGSAGLSYNGFFKVPISGWNG